VAILFAFAFSLLALGFWIAGLTVKLPAPGSKS
jgi:hypothetical protein